MTTARADDGVEPQTMTFVVNDTALTAASLPLEWRDVEVEVPKDALVPGENTFCLVFSNAQPEDDAGRRVAALIERIQLP